MAFPVTLCQISDIICVGTSAECKAFWIHSTWPSLHVKNFRTLQKRSLDRLLFLQCIKVYPATLNGVLLNRIIMLIKWDEKKKKPLQDLLNKKAEIAQKLCFCHETYASIPRLLRLFPSRTTPKLLSALSSCFNEINCLPRQSPWQYSKKKRLYGSCYVGSVKPVNQAWNVTYRSHRLPLLLPLTHLFLFYANH